MFCQRTFLSEILRDRTLLPLHDQRRVESRSAPVASSATNDVATSMCSMSCSDECHPRGEQSHIQSALSCRMDVTISASFARAGFRQSLRELSRVNVRRSCERQSREKRPSPGPPRAENGREIEDLRRDRPALLRYSGTEPLAAS